MASNTETWTDEKLLDAIKAGGLRREAAWKHVYAQYQGKLRRNLVRQGGKPEELEDLLGDVFSAIDKTVGKEDFGLHSGSFANYLWHCVRNRWIYERKKSKLKMDEIKDYQVSTGGNPDTPLRLQEVLQRVAALGEPCRTILLMKSEGFESQEIADAIHLAVQSVKNRLVDCRKRLINLLGGRELY